MWHEARRSERKVHDIMDAARKRAERRAVFLAKRRGDPHQQLKVAGTRCRMYHDQAMYQATQDQHGLIPWNGKKDNLIDRFDGRALLDFIREADKTRPRREKTEEEEELEELVNFERYRDLIKRRRRGFSDEQGLLDVDQELESRAIAPLLSDRQRAAAGKGTYAQVGFAYDGDGKEGSHVVNSDEDDDDDDLESSSEDSEDEEIECIGKDHGVQRFNWMAYMDRKAKEAEKRQKEAAKGDPSMRKLSRKERRKASQQEREREREAARISGHRYTYSDPYREPRGSPTYHTYYRSRRGRSRSRSRSLSPPGRSRRHGYSERTRESDTAAKRKPVTGKIEYITEFGCDNEGEARTAGGISPPPSPPSQADPLNRHPTGRILEALHGDPAASVGASFPTDWEKNNQKKEPRISTSSTSSAIAKLSKPAGSQKAQQGEKKETPQERLKRIMSKQLNKQIKKDTVSEMLKRREQDRQRQEKLAETRRIAHYRRRSHSSSRSYSRSRSRSHSPARHARSRSRSPTRSPSRSSYPRSPRNRMK